MREVFQQNFMWCCTHCWQVRQILQPIYGKNCPCGQERPSWAKHKREALPWLLKAARDGDYALVDRTECPGCTATHESGPLVLCTDCGSNWFAGWEYRGFIEHFAAGGESAGYGVDENFEIIQLTV